MNGSQQQNQVIDDFDYPTSQNSGVYDKEEQDFLKNLVNVDDVLENFEHRVLRGEIKKQNVQTGEEYWDKMPGANDENEIMNEIGVRELMSRIIGKITKVARLTYKTDEEIYKDLFYFDLSISELIAKRCDVWEMSIENAKSIKDSCVELVWDVVASSRDGFFAINLRSTYSRSDISRVDSQSSGSGRKSFLGIPLPGRK